MPHDIRRTLYVFAAAVIGSCMAFLIARYAARSAIERRVAQNPRFSAIDAAVADQGLKIVFLMRLSPVFPFNLLNYALGLTRVSFRDYTIASLGMLFFIAAPSALTHGNVLGPSPNAQGAGRV